MIDTLKLQIALTKSQYAKVKREATNFDQWVFLDSAGEMHFLRRKGLSQIDSPSFHRSIRWDIPGEWNPDDSSLTIELSVPKYWYGHNVRLLYDFYSALCELKRELDRRLHCRLPEPRRWRLLRADFCYAWNVGSERNARLCIDSLKHLHFPRKKPHVYDSSIMFAARTYSIKFYRKHPEFVQHDRKVLLQDCNASPDWVDHWERMAKPIVRYEATLRRQYLKRAGITTVADLLKPHYDLCLRGDWGDSESHRLVLLPLALCCRDPDSSDRLFHRTIEEIAKCLDDYIQTGQELWEPKGVFYIGSSSSPRALHIRSLDPSVLDCLEPDNTTTLPCWHVPSDYPPGRVFLCDGSRSIVIIKKTVMEVHLEKFLNKFLRENRGMQSRDEVRSLLLEHYKPNKAMRLYGTWLSILDIGSDRAKELYGNTAFYRDRKLLENAGVSLVEPPRIVPGSDSEILRNFKFEIPSIRVTNPVDDNRTSENVLNLTAERLQRSLDAM